jgi:hypothetical protein
MAMFSNLADIVYTHLQFHIPVIHQSGWCLYTWDMMNKVIHIFDPLLFSPSDIQMEEFHEIVADKLHVALFTCFYKFFSGWHVDCINWKKTFPDMFTTAKFRKYVLSSKINFYLKFSHKTS